MIKKKSKKGVGKKSVKKIKTLPRAKKSFKKKPTQLNRRKGIKSDIRFNRVRNILIIFVILTLISYMLYTVSNVELYISLFFMLIFIFASLSLALLIALLVLFYFRGMK